MTRFWKTVVVGMLWLFWLAACSTDNGAGTGNAEDQTGPCEEGLSRLGTLRGADTTLFPDGVFVDGDIAYAVGPNGLSVIDIQDPSAMVEVGYLESVSANNVFVSDDIAFACEDDCVMVDVSAPTAPVLLGPLGQPDSGNGHEAFAVGDTVYAAGIFGLHVYDISDIASPEEIGYLELPATPEAIWVEGDLAYLAHDQTGLVIADITDPFAPTLAGELVAILDGRDVHVKDGFAYLAANDDGVRIVDVSDPSEPEEVGSFVADYEVRVVRADGDKIYIGGEIDGVLTVLDAADPTSPTPLYTDDYFFVHDLKVQQNVIYIVSGISGMAAFEITVCD